MDLSIIIVNYNTLDLTRSCIESIKLYTHGVKYEIIVVDNDSIDGSKELFSSLDGITFIESGANIGFGRANNIGFKQSTGRYLVMLNSDTILVNDILSRMVSHFDSLTQEVACIGSLLVHGDNKPSFSFGHFVCWRDEFRRSIKQQETRTILGNQKDVDFVSGADLFVRRSIAEKYGLFDEDFFMYYEDMEIGFRYHSQGLRSIIFNERGIIHLEGASLNNTYKRKSIITKSYFLYLRKTLSINEFRVAKVCIFLRRVLTVWHNHWSFGDSLRYIKLIIKA